MSVDNSIRFCALFITAAIFFPFEISAQMSIGFNFQDLGWSSASDGEQPEYNYFATKINWSTTTNPWNPTFIAELIEAKARCLRFMDWGQTNGSDVTSWSQRIPKTANHYLSENTLPGKGDSGYGVAYEWMIDLCNRVNADMWVCVPHQTDTNYSYQLAALIKNNLNSNLKVYVEYSNEGWNDAFPQTDWLDKQRNINGLANPLSWQGEDVYGFGNGGDCRWSEYVYFVCRTMNQFNKVFGTDNPRVVKVMAGQAAWGRGTGSNQMCQFHMACLKTSICNPWGVKIDAYAIAPYWSGGDQTTEAAMRAGLADCVIDLKDTRSALTGSNIPLVCYEGGPDNFLTENMDTCSFQYQLTIDALNEMKLQVQGIFNYYTFNGGAVWGLKNHVGDNPAMAPKWRGYLQWLSTVQETRLTASKIQLFKFSGASTLFNLLGQQIAVAGVRKNCSSSIHGLFISVPDNSSAKPVLRIR
jgi:hypothetical protein